MGGNSQQNPNQRSFGPPSGQLPNPIRPTMGGEMQDRMFLEHNILSINDQLNYINTYNQSALYHNQQLLELQES